MENRSCMLSTNTDTLNLTFGTFDICVHDAVSRRRSSAMKPARRRASVLSAFVFFLYFCPSQPQRKLKNGRNSFPAKLDTDYINLFSIKWSGCCHCPGCPSCQRCRCCPGDWPRKTLNDDKRRESLRPEARLAKKSQRNRGMRIFEGLTVKEERA